MKQKTTKLEILVGLLIVGGILIFIAYVSLKIKSGQIFAKNLSLYTILDKGYGLSIGSKVTFNGVDAGVVNSVAVNNEGKIRVEMKFNDPFYNRIPVDSHVEINIPVAFGSTSLNIIPGKRNKKMISGNFIIPDLKSAEKGELNELTGAIKGVVNQAGKVMEQTSEFMGKANNSIGNIEKATNDIPEMTKTIKGQLKKMEKTQENVDQITLNLGELTNNLKSISEKVDNGEGALGKFINDPSLYDSAKDAVDSAAGIVDDIKRTKTFVGIDYDYYSGQKIGILYGHLRIEPRPTRYFLLGGAFFMVGNNSPIFKAESNNDFDAEIEFIVAQKLWDNKITLRGGLLEGKLGGGIDWEPIGQNKLMLSLEGRGTHDDIDFTENLDNFMLRFGVRKKITAYIHLDLGVDNIMNDPAFYAGIGFEYLDEDITKIISLISAGK